MRLLVLVLTLPLILTAAFVGLIDGLVRRDVRRFGAGRESGFIYHRAKASLMPLAVLPWVTYLALPISVHPLVILLPSAATIKYADLTGLEGLIGSIHDDVLIGSAADNSLYGAGGGDTVEADQPVVVLEAMKMENNIGADKAGTIAEVKVAVGDTVGAGDVVVVIE